MKKEEAKKEIKEELYMYVDTEKILCGKISEVAKKLLALEDKIKESWKAEESSIKYDHFVMRFSRDYDGDLKIKFDGVRLETDEECNKRMLKNEQAMKSRRESVKKRKENNKKRELATFLRLQKKYAKWMLVGCSPKEVKK